MKKIILTIIPAFLLSSMLFGKDQEWVLHLQRNFKLFKVLGIYLEVGLQLTQLVWMQRIGTRQGYPDQKTV